MSLCRRVRVASSAVIDDIHHEDLKDALRALNARLVELDDRVPDDEENTRKSLTGAWRAYNRLARVVLVFDRERSAPLRHIGLFQYARYPGTRELMRYRDVDAHTKKLSRVPSPQARLPTTSGVWTDPRWVPVESKT